VEWIQDQDRDRLQALVKAVMNLWVLAPHSYLAYSQECDMGSLSLSVFETVQDSYLFLQNMHCPHATVFLYMPLSDFVFFLEILDPSSGCLEGEGGDVN
jgi:hypothetical protein